MTDAFQSQAYQDVFKTASGEYKYFNINKLKDLGHNDPQTLPYTVRILLESALRNYDGYQVRKEDIINILQWRPDSTEHPDIAFKPGRVILQDFTGVPCVVDLAAMRQALKELGGDFRKINPQVPCDLVIDHSVQVDYFGSAEALNQNVNLEFQRNHERYEFLKWGQKAFENFSVVPPATGIVHQVNLEYLAKGVLLQDVNGERVCFPDSLVGTDSHTTMINGLGILGWGVGGIEAEAVMLGEPISMLRPDVIGVKLSGQLKEGVTATDLVLTITEMLRAHGVVGKFVEFFGPGLKFLSLPDRATISNMAPEYGATVGVFPIDNETLRYLRLTGRSDAEVELVETYMKKQGLFYDDQHEVAYTDQLALDLNTVVPSLAGPKRPQDRIAMPEMKSQFNAALTRSVADKGFGVDTQDQDVSAKVAGVKEPLTHGSVVIAAITSCTNTSNPSVLLAAGLVAQKAIAKGLSVPGYVKTSFAPGSQVVNDYLQKAGLMSDLEKLGFHIVGYGCTTCIGNSGPLPQAVADVIVKEGLVVASVLSGNRNFEGRVNPHTKANYLASPPLVVAYALAGRANIDLETEPLGQDASGADVFLKDIWPTQQEIQDLIAQHVNAESFKERYSNVSQGNELWNAIASPKSDLYEWKDASTYIQNPPFFNGLSKEKSAIQGIQKARVLVKVGDSITTDHISPAGAIAVDSPAGKYLQSLGVTTKDFNSYGSRRGNDRVMTRGTFANIRLRNQLAPGTEGSWTTHFPSGEKCSIFDAAQKYQTEQTPLIVLSGKEYGTGSSRDWAAKGTALLGVKAVLAESYERIHRSNLAGMGVMPLQYQADQSADSLGLQGDEIFDFSGIDEKLSPQQSIHVIATPADGGEAIRFTVTLRLDTPVEIDYYRNGGILPTVLKKLAGVDQTSSV